MPNIDFVAQDICEDNLCDISSTRFVNRERADKCGRLNVLLLLIPIQITIYAKVASRYHHHKECQCLRTFELLSDIGHLLVNPLLLQFLHSCTTNICDELDGHRIHIMFDGTQCSLRRTCVNPRILVAMLKSSYLVSSKNMVSYVEYRKCVSLVSCLTVSG